MNEEQRVIATAIAAEDDEEFFRVYNSIPYKLIKEESENSSQNVTEEINQICKYYRIYKKGEAFHVEGTNGDYVPAKLRYKLAYSLINKEARFLFAEQPDIKVEPRGNSTDASEESENALSAMNNLLTTVLSKNMFESRLLKAAKDCFIGKRVACLVNFNEEDGITISFIKSVNFLYKTKPSNQNVLSKFVCFTTIEESSALADRRILKKKFTLEDDGLVYLEEQIYDGTCALIETITNKQPTKLTFIPAVIIINDGLTGEILGESEVEDLKDFEYWYSKLSNADKDAQRKSMNPTKYVVDMENNSTKNLSTSPGALWDLGSDQNLENAKTEVGMLEPNMNYSEALKTTLERIKTSGYEQVDMPNISNETMSGVITSGKALKAIYWPLIVRCKEKMKEWGPALSAMADIIIKGSMIYPNCITEYTNDIITPVDYKVTVEQNTPLPEDEIEEKTTNLAEVEAQVMSKKTYMKRWYGLTDGEVDKELQQIALERQILDDSAFGSDNNGYNGDNKFINPGTDDFNMMGFNSIKSDGTDEMGDESQGGIKENPEVSGNINDIVPSYQTMTKLSATQTSSLVRILSQYKNGSLSRSQAISIMMSMGMSQQSAERLLDDEER